MKHIRLRVALIVGLISMVSAGLMQVFNGAYFLRDLPSILPDMPRFFLIVAGITLAACLYIAVRLGKLTRVLAALSRGEEVTREERLSARRVLAGIPLLLVIVNVIGFVLGPILTIGMESMLGGAPFDFMNTLLYEILNVAMGVMAALQEITVVDSLLVRPREALGITEFSTAHGEIGIRLRLILVAIASTVLAGTLVTVAGLGFYRATIRLITSLPPDAVSSASFAHGAVLSATEWGYLRDMGLLVLLVIGWAFVIASTAVYGLRAQITALQTRLRQIASGEADLTQRVSIVQFDEVGMLTDAINALIARLQGLVVKVRDAAQGIFTTSHELTDSTRDAKKSVGEIRSSLNKVEDAASNQEEVVADSHTTLSRLSASITTISSQVSTQASYVEESSAAITQIAANITSVSKLTEQANEVTRSLTGVASKGAEDVQEMEKSMEEITKASASVNEIVSVISHISSQTNLLAMNAAIEAAHAGEAGRGFAVVADEVRNLAESSARSAKQIMQVIKQMGGKIAAGARLSAQVQEAFTSISKGIESAASMIETIASSMSEQKAGANEVLSSVSSLIAATDGIKSCTAEQTESSRQMEDATAKIVEAARQIAGAIAAQIRGVEALAAIVEKVDGQANENTRSMSELSQVVSGFTLK